jgi:DegV family protein with EDD domain
MSIKIVTDSTCDLPAALIDEYDITVIPLYINVGSKGYLDGIELSRQDFYTLLPDCDPLPTTAVPGSDKFKQVYQALADQGATQILSIHISHSLSATADVARVAAQETTAVSVTVIDSGQLSLGCGFMVETAAKAARDGRSMTEIIALIKQQGERTHVIAALDTLEFLRRSGRMNSIVAGLGSLLQVKPILKMHLGQPTSERVRTSSKAIQRLITLLAEQAPLERVAMVHTNAASKADALRQNIQHLLPAGKILSVDITPVLGTHLGPGAVGYACITSRP